MVLEIVIASALLVGLFFVWRVSYYMILIAHDLHELSTELYDMCYYLQEESRWKR